VVGEPRLSWRHLLLIAVNAAQTVDPIYAIGGSHGSPLESGMVRHWQRPGPRVAEQSNPGTATGAVMNEDGPADFLTTKFNREVPEVVVLAIPTFMSCSGRVTTIRRAGVCAGLGSTPPNSRGGGDGVIVAHQRGLEPDCRRIDLAESMGRSGVLAVTAQHDEDSRCDQARGRGGTGVRVVVLRASQPPGGCADRRDVTFPEGSGPGGWSAV